MNIAIIENSKFEIKEGTKTVWNQVKLDVNEKLVLTEEQVQARLIDSMKFYRHLSGSERAHYKYTDAGYMPYQLVSKSPCRTIKKVRDLKWYSITCFYGKNKTWFIDKKSKQIFGHRLKSGESIIYNQPKPFTRTLKEAMK